ncbi:MAG: TetR/AcrR family transcriptional regulator [Atopobiaceae bacterium]|jgi:AcrR family transcriptional regulator|nr:TetR/AcrR family transcriptional regulator [Atopobiaceae bacterium]
MEDEDIDQRQRIIDAAKRVFATKGLNGASLREIAREAGVTTGAIYYHFENKNDLLAQVMSKQVHYVEGLSPTNEDGTEKDPAAFLAEVEEGTSRRLLDKEWQRLHMVLAGEAVAQEGEDLAHHRAVYEDVIDKTSRYFSLALGTQDGEKGPIRRELPRRRPRRHGHPDLVRAPRRRGAGDGGRVLGLLRDGHPRLPRRADGRDGPLSTLGRIQKG